MDLESLLEGFLSRVAASDDLAALDAVRVEALGKKGAITAQLKALSTLAPDDRREAGARKSRTISTTSRP